YSKVYSFVCDHAETWQLASADPNSPIPASHSASRAPGAKVALSQMYTSSRTMLDSRLPATGARNLSDPIHTADQAAGHNLPKRVARLQYAGGTPDVEMAEHGLAVLDRNAAAAASIAHCEVEQRWVARSRPGRANHVLAEALYANLEQIGPPEYGPEAVETGQAIQTVLGVEPMEKPFLAATEELIEPQEA